MTLTIRKVENAADFRAFFEFPWRIYHGDANWVPPLLSMRDELLDKQKNPAWAYMEGDYFGAWRGDELVGTVAAFVNHRHNEFHHERVGWFGAFEVRDDPEAATALLDTAADWAAQRSLDALRGPQTFTTHEDVGLLIDGFTRPVLLMPYHHRYYQRLVEGAGFHKALDLYSFYLSRADVEASGLLTRLEKLTQGIMKRSQITVRAVDRKRLKNDFALFRQLYNEAWDQNWGFVPMTDRELDALVESLGMFFEPRLAFFAYVQDDPAGFVLPVPDFNQVLKAANPRPGEPEIFTLLKALYYWKINPVIDWVRSPLFGVKAAYRKRGVDAVLLFHGLRAILALGFDHSDQGWILESNDPIVHVLTNFGCTIYKTHRLYIRPLTAAGQALVPQQTQG